MLGFGYQRRLVTAKSKTVIQKKRISSWSADPTGKMPDLFMAEESVVSVVDFSMTLEMFDVKQGNKVWSCSISCEKQKAKGKTEKVVVVARYWPTFIRYYIICHISGKQSQSS